MQILRTTPATARRAPALIAATSLIAALEVGCAADSAGDRARFATPERAVEALVDALREGDDAKLHAILGDDTEAIISSGDPVADAKNRKDFLSKYERRHDLVPPSGNPVTLTVGDDQWPMPIPVVRSEGGWIFDTEEGLDELISRRIGDNEIDAVQVCLAVVDAQWDYAHTDPDKNGIADYALKFLSDPDRKNGLYWKTPEGEPPSPLGPLVVAATAEGYAFSAGGPTPYHGYYYRMLSGQGAHASGGALDYKVQGKLIGGFAVVAWPAQVNNSGVMTFIVNQDGVVYEKYLGGDTDKEARAMDVFDPGPGWTKLQGT